MTDVLVVGAGPTGLTAAAEAVRHGLSVRIVDTNKSRSIHSKALVLHSRSLELFTDMGFVEHVLQSGQEFRALNIFAEGKTLTRIDFRTIDWQDAIYPYWLTLPQSETERHLEEHLARLGIQVERQTQLTDLIQHEEHVQVKLNSIDDVGNVVSQEIVEVPWLIGCDGARSTTRKLCQIPYEGTTEDDVFILGDVHIKWDRPEDEGYNFLAAEGILLVVPLPEPQRYRIIAHMLDLSGMEAPEITLDLLQTLMDRRTGLESRLDHLVWHSSFSVKHLVAAHHHQGRVFLAGDAAHIHSPVGGQGLNTGIQDAYNLMWKLALVHQGRGRQKLLDSYDEERHKVAEATISKVSFATNIVTLKHPVSRAIRNQLAAILVNTDVVQNRLGRDVGMLDISYRDSNVVGESQAESRRTKRVLRNGFSFDKGPSSGDRAPNVLYLDDKGVPHSLVDNLYGTKHTLLFFPGLSERRPSQTLQQIRTLVDNDYTAVIHPYLVTTTPLLPSEWKGSVIINTDGAIHRRYGAMKESLYLIRPDHHIGFRSQPVDQETFLDYLEEILIPSNGNG